MASTELTTTNGERQRGINALSATGNLTPEQVALLKQTVARGATDDELRLFVAVCGRTGLDPFTRQIHCVKRWDSNANGFVMAIQTGIDGYRLIAERTTNYDGQDAPQWCGPDGKWQDVWLSDDPPAAARVAVYSKDSTRPTVGIARWKSYVQTKKDGAPNSMWRRMDAEMLAKCAEALALRKRFPQDLADVYTDDEMEQAAPERIGRATRGMTVDAEKSSAALLDEAMDEPDSIAEAVEAARPQEPAVVPLMEFFALCKKAEKSSGRVLVKASPAGSKDFWFVASDIISQTLVGDEKEGSVLLRSGDEQRVSDERLSRLFDGVQAMAERTGTRSA